MFRKYFNTKKKLCEYVLLIIQDYFEKERLFRERESKLLTEMKILKDHCETIHSELTRKNISHQKSKVSVPYKLIQIQNTQSQERLRIEYIPKLFNTSRNPERETCRRKIFNSAQRRNRKKNQS